MHAMPGWELFKYRRCHFLFCLYERILLRQRSNRVHHMQSRVFLIEQRIPAVYSLHQWHIFISKCIHCLSELLHWKLLCTGCVAVHKVQGRHLLGGIHTAVYAVPQRNVFNCRRADSLHQLLDWLHVAGRLQKLQLVSSRHSMDFNSVCELPSGNLFLAVRSDCVHQLPCRFLFIKRRHDNLHGMCEWDICAFGWVERVPAM